MKPRMKYPTLVGLILLTVVASVPANATSPRLRDAVNINSMELLGNPLPGNTIELKLVYTSHVGGEARLNLICQGEIKPQNALENTLRFEEPLSLVAGQTVERRITLSVKNPGASHISVGIALVHPVSGYLLGDSRYLNIELTNEEFRIFDDRGINPSAIKTIAPYFAEDNPLKGGNGPMGLNTLYNVSITGRVELFDQFQGALRGLYGNTVQLWFRNTSNPGTWYHPVYSSDCLGTRHTHYDRYC